MYQNDTMDKISDINIFCTILRIIRSFLLTLS